MALQGGGVHLGAPGQGSGLNHLSAIQQEAALGGVAEVSGRLTVGCLLN